MEKVKLHKSVADAIELMRAKGATNSEIVSRHVHEDHIQVNGYVNVRTLSLEFLIKILYYGYEVEETPEDKVREQYNSPKHFIDKGRDTDTDIYRKGILFAVNTLGIKIEGVNT